MSAPFDDRWVPLAPHRGGRHARCPWIDASSHRHPRRARAGCRRPPGRRRAPGKPIRIGSTLALTGPLAPTALSTRSRARSTSRSSTGATASSGDRWSGSSRRPVQAGPRAQSLREAHHGGQGRPPHGPLRHQRILAAMGVAQRYQKMLIHHTFGMPHLANYEMHFPVGAFGPEPSKTVPAIVFDAPRRIAKPPKTVAIVTGKFPSAHFMSAGAREAAEQRGLKVVSISSTSSARGTWPDRRADQGRQSRLPVGGRARTRRQPAPRGPEEARLHAGEPLPPLPGARAAGHAPEGKLRCPPPSSRSIRRSPTTRGGGLGAALPRAGHQGRAALHGVDVQAAATFAAWQVLEAAVTATKSLDDKVLAQWLQEEQARHDHRQAALRRAQQLRRRPHQGEAGAGQEVGDGVAEGVRGAGRPRPAGSEKSTACRA